MNDLLSTSRSHLALALVRLDRAAGGVVRAVTVNPPRPREGAPITGAEGAPRGRLFPASVALASSESGEPADLGTSMADLLAAEIQVRAQFAVTRTVSEMVRALYDAATESTVAFRRGVKETDMESEAFNISLRRFLKQVGVTSQQEIERVVRESGLAGQGKLTVRMALTAEGTDLRHVVEGEIDLG